MSAAEDVCRPLKVPFSYSVIRNICNGYINFPGAVFYLKVDDDTHGLTLE
jgi:hypothetical protein